MFNYEDEDYQRAFMWQSFKDDDVDHGVIHELAFFTRDNDGRYDRVGETHYERAYELPLLKQMLSQAALIQLKWDQIFRLLSKKKTQHDGSLSVTNKESSHESSRDGC